MKIKTMAIKPPDDINWTTMLILLAVSGIGSIANYAFKIIKGSHFEIVTLICHMLVSGFGGALMFFIASRYNWDFEAAGIACGVAGWSGATLVNALEGHLIKRLTGRDINKENK